MLFLRALLFTVLIPGTVTVVVPIFLLALHCPLGRWQAMRGLGVPPMLIGVAMYLWCSWDFAVTGRGTPAPYDPPLQLVTRGLYRRMRNPIYVAIVLIIAGEALLFNSAILLGYAALLLVLFHLRVVLFEEPRLRRRFGGAYDDYCRAVPRWLPRHSVR